VIGARPEVRQRGIFALEADPTPARVYRWPYANAQQEIGHLPLMAQVA
jgi:hypothetical protein